MKIIPLFLIILLMLSTIAHAADLPLTGDVQGVHDPVIIKCGARYYLFSTGMGIPIRVSEDKIHWQRSGEVFKEIPGWAKTKVPGARDFWAPDISFRNGRYYLYYSVSTFGKNGSVIGMATNATLDPASPDYAWRDEGLVIESVPGRDEWNAIDPNLFIAPDGSPHLVFGSYWNGIQLVALDPTTGKPNTERPALTNLAKRPAAKAVEAPFLVYRNGWYYLFASYDYCCRGENSTYKMKVGRSKTLIGPYKDARGKPLTQDGGTLLAMSEARWRGPGHNSVYTEGDKTYLVYHAYDAENRGARTLRISELRWEKNGWPTLDRPKPPKPTSPAVGAWEHSAESAPAIMIRLLPSGKINREDSADTWAVRGDTLELRWPNKEAPDGVWVDCLELSADRRTYQGKNQRGQTIRGIRVSDE